MRQILLFPAIFFACLAAAYAEQGDNSNTTASPTVGGVFPHFSQTAGGKAEVQNYRMIAKAYARFYDAAFVAVDSTTYQYGAYRGSIPNIEDINNDDHVLFDISVKYRFS